MGTDIFLRWNGITDKEMAAQSGAARDFRLDTGHTGYLRAAIGMKRENALLRSIFPAKYWYSTNQQAIPYDFEMGLLALNKFAKVYLRSVEQGTEPDLEGYPLVAAMDKVTNDLIEERGYEKMTSTDDLTLGEATRWLREVAEFFGLGAKKQTEGKDPRVFISW